MEQMLVTQILKELSTLDARINKAIKDAKFIDAAKTADNKVSPGITKEFFIAKAKASKDSCLDLIERRKKLKGALVASNAVTMVTIGKHTMTVAAAIERKNSIDYELELLDTLKRQYTDAQSTVLSKNVTVEANIDKLVQTAYGKESKVNFKSDDYASIADPYRAANEYSLVDPLNVKAWIDELEEELNTFLNEVDSVLQISNCTTVVEF